MRDYICRGKRKDNGEWIFGFIKISPNTGRVFISVCEKDKHGDNWLVYEVIPGTVGQFTGLPDKNGKQIFEGDILTAREYLFTDKGKPNYYGVVFWYKEGAQFGYKLICANSKKNGISNGICGMFGDTDYKFEVIGNIHDNPELLKT